MVGWVRAGWFAVWMAAFVDVAAASGLRVSALEPGSIAAQHLRAGDRLLAWRPAGSSGDFAALHDPWQGLQVQLSDAVRSPIEVLRERDGVEAAVILPSTDWGLHFDAGVALDARCSRPTGRIGEGARAAVAWALLECGLAAAQRSRTAGDRDVFLAVDTLLQQTQLPSARAMAALHVAKWQLWVRDWRAAAETLRRVDSLPLDAVPVGAALTRELLAVHANFLARDLARAAAALPELEARVRAQAPDSILLARTWIARNHVDSGRGQGLAPGTDPEPLKQRARNALRIARRDAPGSVDEAAAHASMGALQRALANYDLSSRDTEKALALFSDAYGYSHYQRGTLLQQLALTYWDDGQLLAARRRLQEAIVVGQRDFPESETLAFGFVLQALLASEVGDQIEAGEFAERAEGILHRLKARPPNRAPVAQARGLIALRSGRLEDAERLLGEAREAYAGHAPSEASWMELYLGDIALRRGQRELARRRFEAFIRTHPVSRTTALAHLGLAQAYLEDGQATSASRHATTAKDLMRRVDPSSAEYALALHLGARAGGDRAEHCRAVEALDASIGDFSADPRRRGLYQHGFRDIYLACIDALLPTDPSRAFAVSEAYRSRGLLETLVSRPATATASAGTIEEMESIQSEIAAVASRPTPESRADGEAHHQRLASLRARAEEIRAFLSRDADVLPTVDARQAAGLLAPGMAAISWVVGRENVHAFVLRADRPAPIVVSLGLGEDALRERVERFRASPATEELGRLLFHPLEPHLEGIHRLLVVPEGSLHSVSFAGLRTRDGRYVVEWFAVGKAASLSVMRGLQQRDRERRPHGSVLVVGDPALAAYPHDTRIGGHAIRSLSPLLHARSEAKSISRLYGPAARWKVANAATESAVRTDAATAGTLHLAVHGVFEPTSPLGSALVFAPGPAAARDGRDDGLVRLWEVIDDWKLDAGLVVLSACDTGIEDLSNGDGLSSFARAFQYAGAGRVVDTLWQVRDRASERLMVRFHRELLAGLPPDVALQRAQRAMLQSPVDGAGAARGVGGLGPRAPVDEPVPDWAAFSIWSY